MSIFPQRRRRQILTLLFMQANANIIYTSFHSFCAELPAVMYCEVVCYLVTEVKLLYFV